MTTINTLSISSELRRLRSETATKPERRMQEKKNITINHNRIRKKVKYGQILKTTSKHQLQTEESDTKET